MRTLLLSACLSFLSLILFAQVPQAIKYQAVARDSAGSIMANANITVRISILDSAAGGSVAYSEIHKTGTNQFGLFSISIGRGIQPSGVFANIDWATGSKWMQLEMSQNNGSTFQFVGASELLSVPYALYAETSNTPGPAGPQGVGVDSTVDNGNGTFSFYYSDGSIFTTSNLTGPSGSAGPQGPQGIPGAAGANVDVFSAFHGLYAQTIPNPGSIVQRFDSVTLNTNPAVFVDSTGPTTAGTEITINRTGRFLFLITVGPTALHVQSDEWHAYLEENSGSGWSTISKSKGKPDTDIQVVIDVTSGNRYRVRITKSFSSGSGAVQNVIKYSRITIHEMVGAEGPAGPQGVPGPVGPQGPHGQSDSTFFNPLYPDGTLGMESVTEIVTDLTPYVVPAGKNFYFLHFQMENASGSKRFINGTEFIKYAGDGPFFILGSGDSISILSSSSQMLIFGYLIDAMVTPVNVDLKDAPYIVPNGKQLFLTHCVPPKDPLDPKIQVNGIGFPYMYIMASLPIIFKSGDVISVTPTTWDTLLNGYLK